MFDSELVVTYDLIILNRTYLYNMLDQEGGSINYHGQLSDGYAGPMEPEDVIVRGGNVNATGTSSTMTRQQKCIVIAFCLSNFGIGVFYSLLGPFFPLEAAAKGLSSTMIGLVFGLYELVFVIASPIMGIFLTKIGPRFMFISGIMSCGYCGILFGFLDMSPPGLTFGTLCFAIRTAEGIGAAGVMTASFAIIAHAFPDKVATMFGALEMFSGLGMMVGPPLGGWLYQMGGFRLPFFSSGTILTLLGVATIFILPRAVEHKVEKQEGTMFTLLTSPLVLLASWLMICASGSIGFLDIALAPILTEQLGLTSVLTGLMFLVGPGVYTLMAPIWGATADRIPKHSIWLIIGGYLLGGVSFFFLGPAPFLGLGSLSLWMVIVSQLGMGIGLGTMVVGFQLFTTAARDKGMPDSLATYGLVSGVFTSSFSLGAFLGPVAGGALLDNLGFPWSCTVIGLITAASALVTAIYMFERTCCKRSAPPQATMQVNERTPLLQEDLH